MYHHLLTANYHKKSYEDLENQTGMELKDISKERASEKISFLNITSQPREVIPVHVPWFKQKWT